MGKRTFLFGLVLLAAVSASGCKSSSEKNGKEDNSTTAAEETTAAEMTTAAEDTASAETTTRKKKKEKSGMRGYLEKSRKARASSYAMSMLHEAEFFLLDKECVADQDILYSCTSEGELGKYLRENCLLKDDKDIEFIMMFSDKGVPDRLILCKEYDDDDYVGFCGDVKDSDILSDVKWSEVLKQYGFTKGEYTGLKLKKDNTVYTTEPRRELDLEDEDMLESCILASSIGWEFNRGTSDIPFYLYGKWSKDAPFTADFDWEVPEHGDIEYILVFNGFSVSQVFCWDTERDKKYVGDSDMGFGYTNFIDKTWDDVLEYYGYTQGEYVEY